MREKPIEIKDIDENLIVDFISKIIDEHSKNKEEIPIAILFTNILTYISMTLLSLIEMHYKDESPQIHKKIIKKSLKSIKKVIKLLFKNKKFKGKNCE